MRLQQNIEKGKEKSKEDQKFCKTTKVSQDLVLETKILLQAQNCHFRSSCFFFLVLFSCFTPHFRNEFPSPSPSLLHTLFPYTFSCFLFFSHFQFAHEKCLSPVFRLVCDCHPKSVKSQCVFYEDELELETFISRARGTQRDLYEKDSKLTNFAFRATQQKKQTN